jgi:hypothetical protein
MRRIFFLGCLLLVIILDPTAGQAANTCTYNDPATSFGASYSNNQVSGLTSSSCSAAATTASRVNNTSFGRSTITARFTGDFKFLQRNTSANNAPAFVMVASMSPETKQFPDSDIALAAPANGGCDDCPIPPCPPNATTPKIQAIERHLHRSWPLFGQTYYFGDYNANPPNDPASVTSGTSPYVKWAPYNQSQEYIYMEPTNEPNGGTGAFAWGPQWNGVTADLMHPLMANGHASGTGCAAVPGLTAAQLAACTACVSDATKGYYLKDSAPGAGDLAKSVFKGSILNDYPPAWVHFAWAYGFVINFQLKDSSNNPIFKITRNLWQSANAASCPSPSTPAHAGGQFEPIGSADCSIAYPTYDWPRIQALGMTPVVNDESNMEGGNNGWASANRYPSSSTNPAPATPAGDLMVAGDDLNSFITTCNFCQTKAVLYIGFGIPCGEAEPSWPSGGRPVIGSCTGECNYINPASVCNCPPSTGVNWLPYVSNYLYSKSNIRSYFIGMGPHTTAMRRAAAEGQGKFFMGTDVDSFHDGLLNVISDIIGVATSSATSTVNAVQVGVAGQEELIPRFVGNQSSAIWEGHLFKYYLFSEFGGDCTKAGDLAPIPNPQHKVCDAKCVCPGGICTGRWLVDNDCDLITTDSTGFLFKSDWNGTTLVPRNLPSPPAKPNSHIPAVEVWDARQTMRIASWYSRKVYTAIDTNADGVIDYRDGDGTSPPGMYLITAGATAGNADLSGGVSDAVADSLAPYMGLDGTNRCAQVSSFMAQVGKVLPPGQPLRVCARVILNYMLGEDLANSQNLPPTDPNYLVGNRVFMLGDIFHSSPQDIGPPPSEDGCKYNNRRCVPTLFNGTPTLGLPDFQPLATPANVIDPASGALVSNTQNIDAYQAYYQNEAFGNKRPRALIFGANDGQVHAIQTACFLQPDTVAGKIIPGYLEKQGNTGCVAGSANNGDELWAFVPPDILAKLGNLLSAKHDFYVDNTPMVRDIYAPDPGGVTTPLKRYDTSSALTMDFKRIAILGEREGGTHWHGLDVTNPAAPQFRWMFPQPNTPDEVSVGFSTGDWVPSAPPIVPIRLAAPAGVPGYPTYTDSSGTARAFQEKWVVLLPGGYDAYGVAGKSVYMLDAYTGQKIFQTQDNGTVKQAFPFAALPAAVAWGTDVSSLSPTYNKGFFDTAIVADIGGQIWTLRFNDVGQGYPAGMVNNWFFGRSFKQFKGDDSGAGVGEYRMQHRNPIFQMAAVGRTDTGYMRAFLGTGDRQNMADPGLGSCSLYNPLACGKQKCVMTLSTKASMAGSNPLSSGSSSFKGDLAATYTSASSNSFAAGAAACAPVSTVMNACVSCPSAVQAATDDSPSQPQYACTNPLPTGKWQCSVRPVDDLSPGQRLEVSPPALAPDPNGDLGYYNRQLAVKPFDNAGTPRTFFTTAATAATYDSNALTETGLTNLFAGTFSPTVAPVLNPSTNGSSSGFYFYYPALDERTATNAVLLQNCLVWYTMQPGLPCSSNADCVASGTTCNLTTHECVQPTACNSTSSTIAARTAYLYQINATDGSTNCGLTAGNQLRTPAPTNSFLVPPPPPQPLVSVNSKGQVSFGIITPAGQVSPQAGPGTGSTLPLSFYYTVEMPRQLHQCRHPPVGTTPPSSCY